MFVGEINLALAVDTWARDLPWDLPMSDAQNELENVILEQIGLYGMAEEG